MHQNQNSLLVERQKMTRACPRKISESLVPSSELENDSESVWVKVFTNKTSHFVASWYQPPGKKLAELTSEINLLRSQFQKIKCMHKGNNPPQSMFWETSTSATLFGQIDLTNQVHR